MSERGEINNRERAKQLRDFSGLRFPDGITPTDVDGFLPCGFQGLLDFKNKLFIFLEFKYRNVELRPGQRWAFERVCDAIKDIPVYFIVAKHEVDDCGKDIPADKCVVVEYRFKGEWHTPHKKEWTVKEFIDKALILHEILPPF